jgi:hypothetical protein
MSYFDRALSELADWVGALPDETKVFEGNKYLVSFDTGELPNIFVKPVTQLDPLSKLVLESGSDPVDAGGDIGALAGISVFPIHSDSAERYLAYPYLDGWKPLKSFALAGDRSRRRIIGQAAEALARFHAHASSLLDERTLPSVDPHDRWPDFLRPSLREYAEGVGADYPLLIRYLQGWDGLDEAVVEFRRTEVTSSVCHGDFKLDNVLVSPDETELRIIDYTDLVRYDPHFDLGVGVSELISCWLTKIDFADVGSIVDALDQAEDSFQDELSVIGHFLRCYRAAARSGDLRCERVAYFAGRGLIHNAMGSLYFENHLSRYHWACAHVGANLVANHHALGRLFEEA